MQALQLGGGREWPKLQLALARELGGERGASSARTLEGRARQWVIGGGGRRALDAPN